ncbi:hypothetical protein RHODGE_RHODGE_02940 [Rhodoplanes serenus]|uniref:DUF4142 domain-containing protein n=1 Tax=Rhodoplanes serenus TaxID=200615 RepID=A0A447CWW1_9BRAD|nr:DUF4142 domain-containing protein [Rhodoplanes serenus]VCU09770.1 hypothetical protein RHODGE_RHODGE_02940 [Rhodoplanes serenus]
MDRNEKNRIAIHNPGGVASRARPGVRRMGGVATLAVAAVLTAVLLAGPAAAQLANPAGPGPVAPSTGAQPPSPADRPAGQTTGQAGPAVGQATGAALGAAPPAAEFVRKAAISDMFEVQSSQLAREKADQEGRQFAATMLQAHTKTTGELRELVTSGKVKAELPAGLDDEHRQKLERLRGLSGKAFEDAYETMQVEAHQTAIQLFSAYAQGGDDPELKQWAAKTLPELERHLGMAEKLK